MEIIIVESGGGGRWGEPLIFGLDVSPPGIYAQGNGGVFVTKRKKGVNCGAENKNNMFERRRWPTGDL